MSNSSLFLGEIEADLPAMNLDIKPATSKQDVFTSVENFLRERKLVVTKQDRDRPWGGFFVIDERQAKQFADIFFPEVKIEDIRLSEKLSPKILVVQPGKRLSWQYHHRRAEMWKMVAGEAGVVKSETDSEQPIHQFVVGETLKLHSEERHRLVGLRGWGVIAEIWQHTDAEHPSDEEDIVRVQDDFGR